MNAANQDRTVTARMMAAVNFVLRHDWLLAIGALFLLAAICDFVS